MNIILCKQCGQITAVKNENPACENCGSKYINPINITFDKKIKTGSYTGSISLPLDFDFESIGIKNETLIEEAIVERAMLDFENDAA